MITRPCLTTWCSCGARRSSCRLWWWWRVIGCPMLGWWCRRCSQSVLISWRCSLRASLICWCVVNMFRLTLHVDLLVEESAQGQTSTFSWRKFLPGRQRLNTRSKSNCAPLNNAAMAVWCVARNKVKLTKKRFKCDSAETKRDAYRARIVRPVFKITLRFVAHNNRVTFRSYLEKAVMKY